MTIDRDNARALIARVEAYPNDVMQWDEPGLAGDVIAELTSALEAALNAPPQIDRDALAEVLSSALWKRGNYLADWPEDEAEAYRELGWAEGDAAARKIRMRKAADAVIAHLNLQAPTVPVEPECRHGGELIRKLDGGRCSMLCPDCDRIVGTYRGAVPVEVEAEWEYGIFRGGHLSAVLASSESEHLEYHRKAGYSIARRRKAGEWEAAP